MAELMAAMVRAYYCLGNEKKMIYNFGCGNSRQETTSKT